MKTILLLTALLAWPLAAADVPPPEVQIAGAVLAAPVDLRAGAAVLGYNAQGELVKLREGKNEMICLANDPGNTSFSVACYHRDLEPYMARGSRACGGKSNRAEAQRSAVEGSCGRKAVDASRASNALCTHRQQLRRQALGK